MHQESSRMVTREEGMAFANQHDFLFYESSAKTGENVTELFEGLLKVQYSSIVVISLENT